MQTDQHFLEDKDLAREMVEVLHIQPDDFVIEIGAGTGNITQCVPKCNLILIEKDKGLVKILEEKFPHARIFARDAMRILSDILKPDVKLLGNIPFQITEPLFQLLCRKHFAKASLLVPLKSAQKITTEEPFASVFDSNIKEVSADVFSPAPDTKVAFIELTHKTTKTKIQCVISEILLQSDKMVKNALREALVRAMSITKTDAKNVVEKLLPQRLHERSNRMLTASDWMLLKEELSKLPRG